MLVPVLIFIAAQAAAIRGGREVMRYLVATAVILAAVRGGLLALAGDAGISDPALAVNGIVPAIVAALVIGIAACLRPQLSELSRPLLVGWVVIAAVCVINFAVQTVGLKLYGIGLAQYLVYPTMALIIWPLMEPGDERRLARVIIAAAGVVALTVMLQATGIEGFIQSANAEVDGLVANRYAGITGSYLHTSAFVGAAFVLALGETMETRSWRNRLIGVAVLAGLFSAVILTFSRSGVMISAIGAAILIVFAIRGLRSRLVLIGMALVAVVIAVGVGTLGGVSPKDVGDRTASGLQTEGDLGNELRSNAINDGIERYGDETVVHQVLGIGLASTGNARQLEGDDPEEKTIVESYYLKVITETGLVGLLLIGGFLIWSLLYFIWVIWKFHEPRIISAAAAGLGIGLYNVIYPALETQLLAMTWWLILSLSLYTTWLNSDQETRFLFRLGGNEPSG